MPRSPHDPARALHDAVKESGYDPDLGGFNNLGDFPPISNPLPSGGTGMGAAGTPPKPKHGSGESPGKDLGG